MLKIKIGDEVIVISGNNKGKKGFVKKITKTKCKVIISDINIITKHIKPTNQKPTGSISKIESPIHISNISVIDPLYKKGSRIGFKFDKGKKIRFFKKSGNLLNDTNKKRNEIHTNI